MVEVSAGIAGHTLQPTPSRQQHGAWFERQLWYDSKLLTYQPSRTTNRPLFDMDLVAFQQDDHQPASL
jgi:hypothetical protein